MSTGNINLFVCGDVMTGRGIDQILHHPCKPVIHEAYIKDARDYVVLAEQVNGSIPRAVTGSYIWENIASEWNKRQPLIKIINLETAITCSDHHWPNKAVNYRMHPRNLDALSCAQFDICTLANNHILDWDRAGLRETLRTLDGAGIKVAGAGMNKQQAMRPAVYPLSGGRRLLVFAMAATSSGVPSAWEATAEQPGLYLLQSFDGQTLVQIKQNIESYQQSGDLVIVSIHWGANWVSEIPESHRAFAHYLIDEVGVSLIHGHSSHHPLPIEIYRHKAILYGCGDFINDYEGISGMEAFRGDLCFMYFLEFDCQFLELRKMQLVALQIRRFQLHYAASEDMQWLLDRLNNKAFKHQAHFYLENSHTFRLEERFIQEGQYHDI